MHIQTVDEAHNSSIEHISLNLGIKWNDAGLLCLAVHSKHAILTTAGCVVRHINI